MLEIERGHHLLFQQEPRIVVDARAALLENDLALGLDVFVGEAQILHAVGFHLHHGRQPVLGHTLEIGGDIVIGEGVVLAADLATILENSPTGSCRCP